MANLQALCPPQRNHLDLAPVDPLYELPGPSHIHTLALRNFLDREVGWGCMKGGGDGHGTITGQPRQAQLFSC